MYNRFWVHNKQGSVYAVCDDESTALNKAKEVAARYAPNIFYVSRLVSLYELSTQTTVKVKVQPCHDMIASA